MMETKQLTPFDQVREEFCSRYGLNPEQVSFEINIKGVSKELAANICRDYEGYPGQTFVGVTRAYCHPEEFWLWAQYETKEGEDLDE
jgi:hypothetical protein